MEQAQIAYNVLIAFGCYRFLGFAGVVGWAIGVVLYAMFGG